MNPTTTTEPNGSQQSDPRLATTSTDNTHPSNDINLGSSSNKFSQRSDSPRTASSSQSDSQYSSGHGGRRNKDNYSSSSRDERMRGGGDRFGNNYTDHSASMGNRDSRGGASSRGGYNNDQYNRRARSPADDGAYKRRRDDYDSYYQNNNNNNKRRRTGGSGGGQYSGGDNQYGSSKPPSGGGAGRFSRGYQGAQIVAAQWSERQDFKHGNGIPQTNFNHRIFFSYLDKLAQTPYIEEVRKMFSDIHQTISGSRYDNMYRVCMILMTPQEYACFDMHATIGNMVEMFYYDGSVLVMLPKEKPLSSYKRRLLDRLNNWLRTERVTDEAAKRSLLERLDMGTEMVLNYFGFTGLIGSVVLKRRYAEKPYPTNGALRHILDPFIAVFLAICDLRENIDIVQSKNTEDLLQLKDTMTKFMPNDFLHYPTISIGANQAIAFMRALKDYLCKTEIEHVKDHHNYEFASRLTANREVTGQVDHRAQAESSSTARYSNEQVQFSVQQAQPQVVTQPPAVASIESQPLPPGWEIRYDDEGRRYFVHLQEWKSQWEDPREQLAAQTQQQAQAQPQQDQHHQSSNENRDAYNQYQAQIQQQQSQPQSQPQQQIAPHAEQYGQQATTQESSTGNSTSVTTAAAYAPQSNVREPYTIEQLHQVLNSHNFKRISHTLDRNAYRDLDKCQTPHDFARIIIRLKGNWKHVFCEHRFKQEYTKHNSESHTCAFAHSEEERNYWDSIRSELGIVINDR